MTKQKYLLMIKTVMQLYSNNYALSRKLLIVNLLKQSSMIYKEKPEQHTTI